MPSTGGSEIGKNFGKGEILTSRYRIHFNGEFLSESKAHG
ncbi:hypothetical protein GcM1_214042 [Golovinomyces cichoracearum]|uniref:Uncharacterized protein n=1 Tax=Golovinomyces cichoracearum TaxID=62708 RepID=A0A420IUA6_9PEZI|nr:hypothetical protein GcM1_214042 [Golovinomyces cichoracearum]